MNEVSCVHAERRLALPNSPFAKAIARREVVQASDGLDREERESALLLVSELIAEALNATEGDVELVIKASPVRLRVELVCQWARLPQVSMLHGRRGLMLIDRLATRWGIEDGDPPSMRKVWFEVHPTPPQATTE